MIAFLRNLLRAHRERKAEALALRNAEHALAIKVEHGRHYGNVCASLGPSLPSQQLAREIEEIRSGRVTTFTRKRARQA